MPNKINCCVIIFIILNSTVSAETVSPEQTTAEKFINHFHFYLQYLPQENVPELFTLRDLLVKTRPDDTEYAKVRDALYPRLEELDKKVRLQLQEEIAKRETKMNALLNSRYGENGEIIDLSRVFEEIKANAPAGQYPADNEPLEMIDEYYSRYITRENYAALKPDTTDTSEVIVENNEKKYVVVAGDCLRSIAAMPDIYGDERYWKVIYRHNIDNRDFLPLPDNPDLISPGAAIQIPPLMEQE